MGFAFFFGLGLVFSTFCWLHQRRGNVSPSFDLALMAIVCFATAGLML